VPELVYEFNLALQDLVPTDPHERLMFGSADDVVGQTQVWRTVTERTMRQLIWQMQR